MGVNPGIVFTSFSSSPRPVFLVEEVDTGHALAAQGDERIARQPLQLLGRRVGERGGNEQLGPAVLVLVVVVVEVRTGLDLAG